MSSLLLAPYNESMRLGQGYNSFLQLPCLGNSVTIQDQGGEGEILRTSRGTSQIVTYSSSFVSKISEVVRAMNISAGSSITTGSVSVSSGAVSVDEIKFQESDLNAVVSVKVTNQTKTLKDEVTFNPINVQNMTAAKFHQLYGDCFISGFIEGGDLHGIVSIKILRGSQKSEIEHALRSQLNGKQTKWTPSNIQGLNSVLNNTETTVTVNWSGGGVIKPSSEEWTLEGLLRVASSFADSVASVPQRTYAILSRYDTVPTFVEYASALEGGLEIRRYESVQGFTSDLLDTFLEYKTNLLCLNDAIAQPSKYDKVDRSDAMRLEIETLVEHRKEMKRKMKDIVRIIHQLNKDPNLGAALENSSAVDPPELWRARLPVRRSQESQAETKAAIESVFSRLLPIAGQPTPTAPEGDSNTDLQQQQAEAQSKLRQLEEDLREVRTQFASEAEEHRKTKRKLEDVTRKLSLPQTKPAFYDPKWKPLPDLVLKRISPPDARWAGDFISSKGFEGTSDLEDRWLPAKLNFQLGRMDITWTPQKLTIFSTDDYLIGLLLNYSNGEICVHGKCDYKQHHTAIDLDLDQREVIRCVYLRANKKRNVDVFSLVDAISVTTNQAKAYSVTCQNEDPEHLSSSVFEAPGGFSLTDFWSISGQDEGFAGFARLGLAWGKDQAIPE